MSDPPFVDELSERVRFGFSLEVRGDVDALYALIDPRICERREHEHEFEPECTLSAIRDHVAMVESVEVLDIEVVQWHEGAGGPYEGRTVAYVRSVARYNGWERISEFSTPWVLEAGRWYTRAIGRKIGWTEAERAKLREMGHDPGPPGGAPA